MHRFGPASRARLGGQGRVGASVPQLGLCGCSPWLGRHAQVTDGSSSPAPVGRPHSFEWAEILPWSLRAELAAGLGAGRRLQPRLDHCLAAMGRRSSRLRAGWRCCLGWLDRHAGARFAAFISEVAVRCPSCLAVGRYMGIASSRFSVTSTRASGRPASLAFPRWHKYGNLFVNKRAT